MFAQSLAFPCLDKFCFGFELGFAKGTWYKRFEIFVHEAPA
jgi:hypothetical protein